MIIDFFSQHFTPEHDECPIEAKHLPVRFQTTATSTSPAADSIMTLADMEKDHILKALKATGGNKSKASELLGISRSALWGKLSTIINK